MVVLVLRLQYQKTKLFRQNKKYTTLELNTGNSSTKKNVINNNEPPRGKTNNVVSEQV